MSKIFSFIKPGVVTGENAQKIFSIAKEKNFAIPAINCTGTDSINAALKTASKIKFPIIIQFSYSGSGFISGSHLMKKKYEKGAILGAVVGANHVHKMAKFYEVSVILHTDHCTEKLLPWIDELLNIGELYFKKKGKPLFSSHMIDLSNLPIKKNISICEKYLKKMEKINMVLEIELGKTGGEEDEINNSDTKNSSLYTNEKDIAYAYKKLIKISNKFIIAASFGNVHGVYKTRKIKLIPEILKNAQKYVQKKFSLTNSNNLNFVFHGGSGSSKKKIKQAINYGVVKVNIDTDIQWARWKGILNYYNQYKNHLKNQVEVFENKEEPNKKYYDPRSWLKFSQISMIKRLKQAYKDLNCLNYQK